MKEKGKRAVAMLLGVIVLALTVMLWPVGGAGLGSWLGLGVGVLFILGGVFFR
jgi:hypothetical protein